MPPQVRRIRPGDGSEFRTIRLAALADAPAAFAMTYADTVTDPLEVWEQAADRRATGDEEATFVAVDGDQWVGLIGAYRPQPGGGAVELVSLWTAPDQRRTGTATALVEAVLSWAVDTQASEVGLWVTRGNDAAQRLYGRCGFIETGDVQPLPSDPCKNEVRMVRRDLPVRRHVRSG